MKPDRNVATLIESYFTERLMHQRNVSANTIASYRDTFRFLFTFAQVRHRRSPSDLALDDLDAPFIGAFLTDLETKRGASAKTRNLRLTAIRHAAHAPMGRIRRCLVQRHVHHLLDLFGRQRPDARWSRGPSEVVFRSRTSRSNRSRSAVLTAICSIFLINADSQVCADL